MMQGAPQAVPRGLAAVRQGHLVPYAGLNLIRFNGIRNYPISAHDSGHPDKNSRQSNPSGARNANPADELRTGDYCCSRATKLVAN